MAREFLSYAERKRRFQQNLEGKGAIEHSNELNNLMEIQPHDNEYYGHEEHNSLYSRFIQGASAFALRHAIYRAA